MPHIPAVVQRLELLRNPHRTSKSFRERAKRQLREWARKHGLRGPNNPTDIESMEVAIRCAESSGARKQP